MAAGPIAPIGDGPLVEAEGGDDRLDGTAMAEQGDHEGHQIDGLLEPVERGIAGGGEGAAAGGASITPFLAAMDGDVAEAELAPCGAVGVVAELALRVHRCPSRGTVWRPCLEECLMDPRFSSPYPRITVQWGATGQRQYSDKLLEATPDCVGMSGRRSQPRRRPAAGTRKGVTRSDACGGKPRGDRSVTDSSRPPARSAAAGRTPTPATGARGNGARRPSAPSHPHRSPGYIGDTRPRVPLMPPAPSTPRRSPPWS